MGYLFLVMGIAATIIFLIKRTARVTIDVVAIKSRASMGFILSGLFFFIGNEACPDYLGAFTVGGACFGMLGDIVLDLKYTKLNDVNIFCLISSFLPCANLFAIRGNMTVPNDVTIVKIIFTIFCDCS